MAIDFYYLSGSPFAWKVWLALEHKRIDYALHVLSVDKGELKTAEYLAINPRGKVPAIVHDGFALWESDAIVDYLEEAFPEFGERLWPEDVRLRATGRRVSIEAELWVYPPIRDIFKQLVIRADGEPNRAVVSNARDTVAERLGLLEEAIMGEYVLGERVSAADFALFPLTDLLWRFGTRFPGYDLDSVTSPRLEAWRNRIKALPHYQKTFPPHWRS